MAAVCSAPPGLAYDDSAPGTPTQAQRPSAECNTCASAGPRQRYSKQAMRDIFDTMSLSALTATPSLPSWKDTCASTLPADRNCVAEKAQVLANLQAVRQLLQDGPGHNSTLPLPGYHGKHGQHRAQDFLAMAINPHWTPAQQAAAYAACAAYQAATLAASAHLKPIITDHMGAFHLRASSRPAQAPTPFASLTAANACTSSRLPSTLTMSDTWGSATTSSIQDSGRTSRIGSMQDSGRTQSGNLTRSSSTASSALSSVVPGSALWEQGILQLLGLQGGTFGTASWLVQSPHITGAMGPIPADAMAAWLLHGLTPKQLGRPVHRPLLEATAADPAGLLVCGLLTGELDREMKPGPHAFKALKDLLPGLVKGQAYSFLTKGLTSVKQSHKQETFGGTNKTAACASGGSDHVTQPETPTGNASASRTDHKQPLAAQTCSAQLLVSHLSAMGPTEAADMTAAVEEISRRAHSSTEGREALVSAGAIPALVRMLQLPVHIADGQPHTTCAWGLFHLLGRSKATPQGCPSAQSAMVAAQAAQHLTSLLKAVWELGGSTSTEPGKTGGGSSTAGAGTSAATQVAAKVQEAATAVLAGLATTPAGKQALLDEAAAPNMIVRLLSSRFSGVVSAAVSAVRNLCTLESFPVYKALFKAGVLSRLVAVVANSTDPALKQNALRILLDLASAALSSPSSPATSRPASAVASPVSRSPGSESSGQTSSSSEAEPQDTQTDDASSYAPDTAVDRLVKRGLPVVLLKLLQKDPPIALQSRAIKVLKLLATQRPEKVLVIIKDFVVVENDDRQQGCTGVQVLQQCATRSTSNSCQEGAVELLQALADAGLVGRRPSQQAQ